MSLPLEPHGRSGVLATRLVSKEHAETMRQETAASAVIVVHAEDIPTLEAFGRGLLTPLDGFMTSEQYERVLDDGTIDHDGESFCWPIPLLLPISKTEQEIVSEGERAVLVDRHGNELGVIDIESIFPWEKDDYCARLFGTVKPDHPGVHSTRLDDRKVLVGGPIFVYPPRSENPFVAKHTSSPAQSRAMLAKSGAKTAVAISTGRFLLREEEYQLLHAVEALERANRHPLGILATNLFEGDESFVSMEMLVKSWQKLKDVIGIGDADVSVWLDDSPSFRFRLCGFRLKPFYAAAREAILHAIICQNLGFTHFLSTDEFREGAHLSSGKESMSSEDFAHAIGARRGHLAIEIMMPDRSAWFEESSKVMTMTKGVGAGRTPVPADRKTIEYRLQEGELPEPRFLRSEVADILLTAFREEMSFVPLVAAEPPKREERPSGDNIMWHSHAITRQMRENMNMHRGCTVWFTGLSGSGKSTLANEVAAALHERGVRTYVLDGDNVRHGLNAGLGFSAGDRKENIRRIGEVAKLFSDAGIVTLSAFISPYREDRALARSLQPDSFLEVWVKADVDVCEARDPKGLYKKARAGEIADFTGISAPYEEPDHADLTVDTGSMPLRKCVLRVLTLLENQEIIPGFRSAETQRKEQP